ncbi:MAG: TIGR00730 family Rossman fold protein [Actinomycetota bacterium]|nr:TIGR00730 family Rossman fold protein [Actinomycetota bacterium]
MRISVAPDAPGSSGNMDAMAFTSLSPEIEAFLDEYTSDLQDPDAQLAREIVMTAVKLAQEQVSRLDRKIVNASLKEMRYAFKVFSPYKGVRKVSIFGSARTAKGDPAYTTTREFSREIASRGWMVITGAGPGIMEAGHEGAGGKLSFGANIRLPFEAKPNPVIANDSKLINFKYFFTRKLTFIKEADAFVLLPGGFGTMDEAFELLTLVQTGKTDLKPIVMLDAPGGTYWANWEKYIRQQLLAPGYVSEDDLVLYRQTDDINAAVEEIEDFFRVYHSQRVVGERVFLRLNVMPTEDVLQKLSEEFEDVLRGPIARVSASRSEIRDNDVPHLPRIALKFDRQHIGRLRQLIDRLNEMVPTDTVPSAKGEPEQL